MKPTLRDYLTIVISLIVIFACGYGIGHHMGARKDPAAPPSTVTPGVSWQDATAARLDAALGLDDTQRKAVHRELEASAAKIKVIRGESRKSYLRELADLHDRIAPFLDETQIRRLDSSRKSLQLLID